MTSLTSDFAFLILISAIALARTGVTSGGPYVAIVISVLISAGTIAASTTIASVTGAVTVARAVTTIPVACSVGKVSIIDAAVGLGSRDSPGVSDHVAVRSPSGRLARLRVGVRWVATRWIASPSGGW